MLDANDFSLPDQDAEPGPAVAKAPAEPPMIVIEYRSRGLLAKLTPPALILAAAMAITSYQRTRVVRPLGPRAAGPSTAKAVTQATPQPAKLVVEKVASALPSTVGPAEKSEPAEAKTEAQSARTASSPFEIEADEGLTLLAPGPEQPVIVEPPPTAPELASGAMLVSGPAAERPAPPVVDLPSLPEAEIPKGADGPEMTKEDILRDIQREAQEKAADRQDMADLKPRATALLIAESIAKIQGKRIPFRNELKEAIDNLGANAGPEIERLCEQYGRDMPDVVRAAYQRATRVMPRRFTLDDEVELMRTFGLPEPVLLDFLSHKLHKTMNTRGGPRDENEVRVKAARQLLRIPVAAVHTVSTPPPLPPAARTAPGR